MLHEPEGFFRTVPVFDCSPVDPKTVKRLADSGCSSRSWDKVFFSSETDPSLMTDTVFRGECRVHLPSGEICGAVLEDCTIMGPVVIRSCALVRGYAVLEGSVLENCGVLTWSGKPAFLGSEMDLGEETGFRRVPIVPTMDHLEAFHLASGAGRHEVEGVSSRMKSLTVCGVIGPAATVTSASLVEETVLMRGAVLSCPGPVRGSLIMPDGMVMNHAQVHGSVLQWRARADTMALVTDSIVGEGSVVERHGMLNRSFLGADSVLGEGEMTASLTGPLTGMHHQSLLIATLWPAGKGNVGYGANAGSNHTSRLPDQELRLGEGFFIGLGTCIKFPADYTRSPHSILATGLTALPQKVSFPFSLIALPIRRPQGVPEGYNQIFPGWMLYDNLYALVRNAWKHGSRSMAVHTPVDTGPLSDEVIAFTRDALERLASCSCDEMPGIGRNFMTEESRIKGMEAYETLLEGADLFNRMRAGELNPESASKLKAILLRVIEGSAASRMKDRLRGESVIDDYTAVRRRPDDEPFLAWLQHLLDRMG
ncbi:MAG: DUF4954 family protein [Candidatus Fermentibacteraceae bacterium]